MKTNVNLGDEKKFVAWGTNGVKNCLELCKMILKKYGLNNYGNSINVYQLKIEKNNKLEYYGDNQIENYKNAINCIDNHLDNGRPIIVGVNYVINRKINEGTTDHFVVIYGRGYDGTNYYYNYYEVGKSDVKKGYNDETNRFIYNPTTPDLYDDKSNMNNGCRFDVTQVRPNDNTKIK